MKYKILIIDDDKKFCSSVKLSLKNHFDMVVSNSIKDAEANLDESIDLVLLDLVFDKSSADKLHGMEFIPVIAGKFPGLPIIIMTGFPSYDRSVSAIKLGAKDFLLKKDAVWVEWENRIMQYCKDYREIKSLRARADELQKYSDSEIIGKSPEIERLRMKVKDLAENSPDASIFIQGETGTGKNLVVKYFRRFSPRRDRPFVETSLIELSSSLIEPELFGHKKGSFTGADKDRTGLFEQADTGILFLDEIGDYSLQAQAKILRFIENKTITPVGSNKEKTLDVQLLMATNKNLRDLADRGEFRNDLYYRINRIKIEIPPLRERKEDIQVLADYFFNHFRVKEHTKLSKISEEVYELLVKYEWPGNVRELQSVINQACTNARMFNDTVLQKKHISREIYITGGMRNSAAEEKGIEDRKLELELQEIDKALADTRGQKNKAAEKLGMKGDQLYYRVKKGKERKIIDKYPNIARAYRRLIDSE